MILTDEEKRLGECITTSDWYAIYRPRLGGCDYQGPDSYRKKRAPVAGAGQLEADSGNACPLPLCEKAP